MSRAPSALWLADASCTALNTATKLPSRRPPSVASDVARIHRCLFATIAATSAYCGSCALYPRTAPYTITPSVPPAVFPAHSASSFGGGGTSSPRPTRLNATSMPRAVDCEVRDEG